MYVKKNSFPSTASMLLFVATLIALAVSWNFPLLATPTPEAALFLGFFLAPLTYFAGICRGAQRGIFGFQDDALKEGIWVFGSLFLYLFILWLRSFGMQSCGFDISVSSFLIILLPQLALNLVTGILICRFLGHVKSAVIVGLLIWLLYFLFQIMWWYWHPSMRFFEPYWFLIVGDLVSGQALSPAIALYRSSTLLYAFALLLLGIQWRRQSTKFWFVLFLIGFAFMFQMKASDWIEPSYAKRQQVFPDLLKQGPLHLHFDAKLTSPKKAQALLEEGSLWVYRLQDRTGLPQIKPIHIWLYPNSDSLSRFTGAQH